MSSAQHSARTLAVALTAGTLCLTLPHAARAQALADPHVVKITRCAITKPRPFSHHPTGTQIAYVNTGPIVLHGVTFHVAYRNAGELIGRTFDDVGTFAPNEPVSHHFDAFSDVEYTGAAVASCAVTAVR